MYLLGYLPRDNRVYLTDKDMGIVSYSLPLHVIEYQTAILRKDFETAAKVLPSLPNDHRNKVARFLEAQGLKELALEVTTDVDQKFELALNMGKLREAFQIATEVSKDDKWKHLGEVALGKWNYGLAEECMRRAKDYEGLLLLYQASGNAKGIKELADMACEFIFGFNHTRRATLKLLFNNSLF